MPKSIKHPDYWKDGIPHSERTFVGRNKIDILDRAGQDAMRKVCRLAREVLDIAAAAAKPGVTTDYIDELVHKACLERDVRIPLMLFDSATNVDSHIPRPLITATSLNQSAHLRTKSSATASRISGFLWMVIYSISMSHGGYHGDLNETYYIGEKAKTDPDSVRVVEAARESLDAAIKLVKPGALFRDYGNTIEKTAKSKNCSVIKTYCGHGINTLFHCSPNVPHYAKNKAVGAAKEGMCFTIEPMIALGSHKDKTWPDDWTSVTQDGKRTAQFGRLHAVLLDSRAKILQSILFW